MSNGRSQQDVTSRNVDEMAPHRNRRWFYSHDGRAFFAVDIDGSGIETIDDFNRHQARLRAKWPDLFAAADAIASQAAPCIPPAERLECGCLSYLCACNTAWSLPPSKVD